MKLVVTILAGCVLGAAIAGIVVHTQGEKSRRALRKSLETETDRLLADQDKGHKDILARLRENLMKQGVPGAKVEKVFQEGQLTVPVSNVKLPEPGAIMVELIELGDRQGRSRTEMMRQLIRNVEYLVDHGDMALPEIRKFLERQEEVDYGHNISGDWRSGRMYTDFLVPPSLRMALFNAARRIGTEEAVQILAKEVETTPRAAELAYLATALEELAPTQHKGSLLAAAHDLLGQPPREGSEQSRLDRNERNWLFGILRRYKDETYASKAEEQLVVRRKDDKGNERVYLDRTVMGYLNEVLGERAMPMLARIYNDPNVPGDAKGDIRRAAASNVGRSTDADNIVRARFTEGLTMLAKTDDRRSIGRGNELVNYYLQSLTSSRNADESNINSRRKFLASLRGSTEDAKVQAKMDKVDQRLQDMLDPEKRKKLGRFSLDDRNRR